MSNQPLKGADLKGCYTAIVTPFKNGAIDEPGFKKLIEFQIENGVHGLVAVGTTGESPTLTYDEHKRVIQVCVETVKGRVPVIAGTGSNNTAEALELTKFAAQVGASASLNVCPYYNKPTQDGIFDHFEYLANECGIPIILYNIPGRCSVNMTAKTILDLSEHENIIGIKEASGSIDQVTQILLEAPKGFAVLAGDDTFTAPIMAIGASGVISTVSNVAPRMMADLCNAALEGNFRKAGQMQVQMFQLIQAMFCESNPVPAKTALSLMGFISNEIRMPLHVLSQEHTEQVRQALSSLKIL